MDIQYILLSGIGYLYIAMVMELISCLRAYVLIYTSTTSTRRDP